MEHMTPSCRIFVFFIQAHYYPKGGDGGTGWLKTGSSGRVMEFGFLSKGWGGTMGIVDTSGELRLGK